MKYIVAVFILAALTSCATNAFRSPASVPIVNLKQVSAIHPKKKVVCALTVNSTDEIEGFAKHFSSDDFQIVELNDKSLESTEASLKLACERRISCDILVASGHFAGSFFGKLGRVTLEDLETLSCDVGCAGIFRKPKEVFLFGCNTLAGKNRDSRTPAEYRRVLIEDGFTPREADQVVAYRYSPVGFSFNSRIRRLFPETAIIYGFDSKAPLGQTSGPRLSSYLKQTSGKYGQYLQSLSQSNPPRNNLLLNLFSGTSLVQEIGDRSSVHACTMLSVTSSMAEKLLWIESSLAGDDAISNIPLIETFFLKFAKLRDQLNAEEEEILRRIETNTKNRDRILALVPVLKETPRLQVQILNLMKDLRWMDPKTHRKNLMTVIGHIYKGKFTEQKRAYLVSIGKELVIEKEDIPEAFYTNWDFLRGLQASRLADPAVIRYIVEKIRTTKDRDLPEVYAEVLGQAEVEKELALTAIREQFEHENRYVRQYSFENAIHLDPSNEQTIDFMIRKIESVCSAQFNEDCSPAFWAVRRSKLKAQHVFRLLPFMMSSSTDTIYLRNVLLELGEVPIEYPEALLREFDKSNFPDKPPENAQVLLYYWTKQHPSLRPRSERYVRLEYLHF